MPPAKVLARRSRGPGAGDAQARAEKGSFKGLRRPTLGRRLPSGCDQQQSIHPAPARGPSRFTRNDSESEPDEAARASSHALVGRLSCRTKLAECFRSKGSTEPSGATDSPRQLFAKTAGSDGAELLLPKHSGSCLENGPK